MKTKLPEVPKAWHEPLPADELERFRKLRDIKVVFDVGARTSLDYLDVKPNAQYHLFEPYPPFHEWLQFATQDMTNVRVNPYGLGDEEGTFLYNVGTQGFHGGEAALKLPVKTLNQYIRKHKITRIDFLKIDAEKYDCKVLQGGTDAIGMARYIQYETWSEDENKIMDDLLKDKYVCEDIGSRNMLCKLKRK